MLPCEGAPSSCARFVVGNDDGSSAQLAIGCGFGFLHHLLFAFAGVNDAVGAGFLAQLQARVARVDADDFVTEAASELNGLRVESMFVLSGDMSIDAVYVRDGQELRRYPRWRPILLSWLHRS